MKKIAMILSVTALIFAFSTTSVSAQKAPKKAKTEKVADTKEVKHEGCTDKAKANCTSATSDKAKAGCTTPCPSASKSASGCCSGKATAAKPVPAPETEKK